MAGNEKISEWLREIQDRLFTVGSVLATDPGKEVKMKLPDLHDADVTWLEQQIDSMNEVLPEMRSFILPGGSIEASHLHLARTVSRRAERSTWAAIDMYHGGMNQIAATYLNRLSDLLFILARVANKEIGDVLWQPGATR
jgi:cob(I)alamin adenosyltransferase